MPANRYALIRYQVIDECLRNRQRLWTLESLMEKVSAVLYEYEGAHEGISRRTIQADIQAMRSEKLGYNAPIVVEKRKYYTYADPGFAIGKRPVSPADLERLRQAMDVLKQMSGFGQFDQLAHMVQKLEGHIQATTRPEGSLIDFERNDQLQGLAHLTPLYDAVSRQMPVRMGYKSFKAREPQTLTFHPWWLKEFKNRWFAVGVVYERSQVCTFALDRILDLAEAPGVAYRPRPEGLSPERYYRDVIGVTVSERLRPIRLVLELRPADVPYILTKPLHHSQKRIEKMEDGRVRIELRVQHNMELERELLSYGEGVTVVSPASLRARMQLRLQEAAGKYAVGTYEGIVNG